MAVGGYDLKIALQQVGTKRVSFGLYKGDRSKQDVVGIKLGPAQIAGLEKEHGKLKLVLKGVCFREDGVFVFATRSEPASGLEMLFNKSFKENKCGALLPIILRKLGTNEPETASDGDDAAADPASQTPAEETATSEPPPPPPPPPAGPNEPEAVWKRLKSTVAPRVAPAIAATPAQGPEILRLVKEALGKEKEALWAEATTRFQQVQTLLDQPAEAKAPAAPDAEKLNATMQKIAPLLKAAITANPARKEEFARPYADFQTQMKAGQYGPAQQSLTRLATLLRPAAPAASATPAAAPKSVAPEIRAGTVDYAKCRLLWDATKKSVHAELQALEKAILDTFADAPAYPKLVQRVRKFDSVLAAFADDLGDLLDDAANSEDPADRQKFHAQAAATVRDFQRRALSDPFLDQLEKNPFVVVKAKQTLTKSLENLVSRIV